MTNCREFENQKIRERERKKGRTGEERRKRKKEREKREEKERKKECWADRQRRRGPFHWRHSNRVSHRGNQAKMRWKSERERKPYQRVGFRADRRRHAARRRRGPFHWWGLASGGWVMHDGPQCVFFFFDKNNECFLLIDLEFLFF